MTGTPPYGPAPGLCVFCSSSERIEPRFVELAGQVGTRLAERGWRLVSGGGSVSMMGAVARAARAGGAHTLGVIPSALEAAEVADHDADELVVTEGMRDRKGLMDASADAFLALPGGYGTLEELFEIVTWKQLRLHNKPIGLLNVAGFFDPLLAWIDRAIAEDFIRRKHRDLLVVGDDITSLLDRLIPPSPVNG